MHDSLGREPVYNDEVKLGHIKEGSHVGDGYGEREKTEEKREEER